MTWISVNTSLPLPGMDVLGIKKDSNQCVVHLMYVGICYREWSLSGCSNYCCGCEMEITHWQHLPETPNEKEPTESIIRLMSLGFSKEESQSLLKVIKNNTIPKVLLPKNEKIK